MENGKPVKNEEQSITSELMLLMNNKLKKDQHG